MPEFVSIGRNNLIEINDQFDPLQQPQQDYCTVHGLTPSSSHIIRRSSSLQFPSPTSGRYHAQRKASHHAHQPNFLHSAICTLKSSSASIYASTLSAAGLLGGVGLGGLRSRTGSADSTEAINLYTMMTDYRCCCGLFRLRTASMLICVFICMGSTLVLCVLLLHSPVPPAALLTPWQCQLLCLPALVLVSYAFLASMLMLLALATDIQFLVLPFLLSCVLNMMGSMALGLVLLLNPLASYHHRLSRIGFLADLVPAGLALLSSALVALNLWFLVTAAFTYVLIRDKRSLFLEYFSGDFMDEEDGPSRMLLRRCSSAPDPLDRVNSAEF